MGFQYFTFSIIAGKRLCDAQRYHQVKWLRAAWG